jgi:hypothetical protein
MGLRYATLLGAVLFAFTNAVACGARMYQVSLKDDTQLPPEGGAEGMNDPDSPNFGLHAPRGWTNLPIHFRVGVQLTADQQKGLLAAMRQWEEAVGRKLFVYEGVHNGVTGDSFNDLYSSLDDGVNGHYVDEHWSKTGKPVEVLATTIWDYDPDDDAQITTADIRFNSNYYVIGNAMTLQATADREVVDMQTLALHELGHLLGLAHMNARQDRFSIMAPTVYIGEGLANRRLSKGDIERIQKVYGCAGKACDVEATVARLDAAQNLESGSDDSAGDAPTPVVLETTTH